MNAAADQIAELIGRKQACAAVGLPRATWYRNQKKTPGQTTQEPKRPRRRGHQPRELTQAERDTLNEVMHSDEFVDQAPAEIYATLLDRGIYLASIPTMYRELHRRHGQVPERRRQATHPARSKPELHATRPNQVWSWDVSKLRGPGKGDWFFLYWILDIFSRYAVGWCISEHETAKIGEQLLTDSINAQDVDPTQLTVHADRGAQQTAKNVAQLYADLGITRSHSRPRVCLFSG